MKFEFIAHEVTICNSPSLKRQEQGRFQAEFERILLPDIIGLEAFPNGIHYKITVEPLLEEENKPTVNPTTGEIN